MVVETVGGTLSAHSPKFQSKLVSLDHLRTLPEPMALGPMHKPVPHAVLVDSILAEVTRRDYRVTKTQLALGAKGAALFGVMDLVPAIQVPGQQERGLSFGFRSANDMSLAIKAVAGTRVFVCDNLALSGDMIALLRKHTTGIDLKAVLAAGFDRFLQHATALDLQIARLQAASITDMAAKALIFDVFAAGIVPVRLFDDVDRFYFKPADDAIDCHPRTMWGVHNAFTRAMKDLSPVRQFGATVALGKHFGIRAAEVNEADVIDADPADYDVE